VSVDVVDLAVTRLRREIRHLVERAADPGLEVAEWDKCARRIPALQARLLDLTDGRLGNTTTTQDKRRAVPAA
jgi:hypothetical protein